MAYYQEVLKVRFVTVRDLRLKSGEVWRRVRQEGELVVTSNGKPVAVLADVDEDRLEDFLQSLRRARAALAVYRIQARAREERLDRLSEADIEAEIAAVRRERSR
jgi:prevent-host-death family protein